MRSENTINFCGKAPVGPLLIILLASVVSIASLPAFQGSASASLEKLKSMAEAQHEIVLILIKKQDYDKAAAEANRIFDMKWPGDQEPLLLRELLNLADAFLQQGQAPLGLKLIERNSGFFKRASSQAAIFKELGYLYKSMNQADKALEYFKKARDMEGGG